ncbi:MAG: DNA-3-methyladenine glycosylase 2 family protein [Saprospiraceae bacterium]|nr:DNA-3-methyladenine glycosylase 2 family protein [Saprospiraceae bacterium]
MDLESALLHLRKDKILQEIIQTTVLPPLAPSGNVYFDLLDSIVSQQLSVKVASIIFNRFCTLFPEKYPSPQLLLQIPTDQLRSAGLSNQKATYMKNVAAFALENNLETYSWDTRTDEEIIAFLTKIKGVGKWTVEMTLMFTLQRPNVFPQDDLGIQQSMIQLYALPESGKLLRQRMVEIAAAWQPHRSLACRYLWRWKNNQPK